MDFMSIIGLLSGVGFLGAAIIMSGAIENFFDLMSVFIVFGGTFAALMITFPAKVFAALPKTFSKVFLPQKFNPLTYIDDIIQIATIVRKSGLLSLEDRIRDYKDDFLRKGIQLAVDSTEADDLRDIMESELAFMIERHKQGTLFFEKGASYAPAFGMMGTLIALINMLKTISGDDITSLVVNMGMALITTFYGSILANLIFIPSANKLAQRSEEEILCKQITIEGLISIINGTNPRNIEEKLLSYIPPAMRKNAKRSGRGSDE